MARKVTEAWIDVCGNSSAKVCYEVSTSLSNRECDEMRRVTN